jgi:type IV pilus modification protein PilV
MKNIIFFRPRRISLGLKKENKLSKGFTLVETLVALSIFSVGILSLMAVLGQGISNTTYAKQRVVAAYLAQEGVEYVRNLRDTLVLYSATSQTGWDAFNSRLVSASCQSVNIGCFFDDRDVLFTDNSMAMNDLDLNPCLTSGCPGGALLYDSTTGKYGYASGIASGFNRKVRIIQVSANETKVISTVSWTQGSGAYSISFSENLFNWIE